MRHMRVFLLFYYSCQVLLPFHHPMTPLPALSPAVAKLLVDQLYCSRTSVLWGILRLSYVEVCGGLNGKVRGRKRPRGKMGIFFSAILGSASMVSSSSCSCDIELSRLGF